jgi:large subunit ribosomal protein L2
LIKFCEKDDLFAIFNKSMNFLKAFEIIFIYMNSIKSKFTSLTQKKLINLSRKKLNKVSLVKNLILGKKNVAGRNSFGKISVRHKGGGHKKRYRKIDFIRNEDSIGIVTTLEYDPYRTAFIASVYDFLNQKYFYMIAPKNLNIGDIIKSGFNAEIKIGHSLALMKIPVGGFIHNISLKENKKGQLTRSAGTSAQLIEKNSKYCRIVLSSGTHKFISPTCQATIGTVSNEFSFFKKIDKAGRSR